MGAMLDRWPVAPELGERTDVFMVWPDLTPISEVDTTDGPTRFFCYEGINMGRAWTPEDEAKWQADSHAITRSVDRFTSF